MKPATKMMSYENSPSSDEDEETALPLVPTILPSPTTTTVRSFLSIIVAGIMMLVTGGGVVLMWDGETAAEGLVVGNPSVMNIVSAA